MPNSENRAIQILYFLFKNGDLSYIWQTGSAKKGAIRHAIQYKIYLYSRNTKQYNISYE